MIQELDNKEANGAGPLANQMKAVCEYLNTAPESPQLAAFNFKTRGAPSFRGRGRATRQPRFGQRYQQNTNTTASTNKAFCRLCHLAELPQSVVNSHKIGDTRCPTLSARDKEDLTSATHAAMSAANDDSSQSYIDILAQNYGYDEYTAEQFEDPST